MNMRKLITTCAFLILSTSVNAWMIAADWVNESGGLISIDTNTNLGWLKLSENGFINRSGLLAKFTDDPTFAGFRFATYDEVYNNMEGAVNTGSLVRKLTDWKRYVIDGDKATNLALFLGTTSVSNNVSISEGLVLSDLYVKKISVASWNAPYDYINMIDENMRSISYSGGENYGTYVVTDNYINISLPATGPISVPEPTTILIFGLALLMLGLIVKRKRNHDRMVNEVNYFSSI